MFFKIALPKIEPCDNAKSMEPHRSRKFVCKATSYVAKNVFVVVVFFCFVLILRIKINNIFKEFHIKVFNTGKLEIPGIQNEETFLIILEQIIQEEKY